MRKITVQRLETFEQPVEVEVDPGLSDAEAAEEGRRKVADGEGDDIGEPQYHSTDSEPSNWTVYNENGDMIG